MDVIVAHQRLRRCCSCSVGSGVADACAVVRPTVGFTVCAAMFHNGTWCQGSHALHVSNIC